MRRGQHPLLGLTSGHPVVLRAAKEWGGQALSLVWGEEAASRQTSREGLHV